MSYERLLGVNIDHVATLRQARGTRYPEPIQAALTAEQAGADAITLHLREDRRHIQDRDVELLHGILHTRMNLEMAATSEMLEFACRLKPADCCLVPEKREELTTEGGLDAAANVAYLTDYCARLADSGVRVSLFIDADSAQLEAAAAIGAPVVEIHTGHYADAGTVQRAVRGICAHTVSGELWRGTGAACECRPWPGLSQCAGNCRNFRYQGAQYRTQYYCPGHIFRAGQRGTGNEDACFSLPEAESPRRSLPSGTGHPYLRLACSGSRLTVTGIQSPGLSDMYLRPW